MHAIDYDEYISAQTLINEGVNVNYKNKYNESCLSVAIKEANLPMIKLLIENGADTGTM
jgi:ankyrin repeat protein